MRHGRPRSHLSPAQESSHGPLLDRRSRPQRRRPWGLRRGGRRSASTHDDNNDDALPLAAAEAVSSGERRDRRPLPRRLQGLRLRRQRKDRRHHRRQQGALAAPPPRQGQSGPAIRIAGPTRPQGQRRSCRQHPTDGRGGQQTGRRRGLRARQQAAAGPTLRVPHAPAAAPSLDEQMDPGRQHPALGRGLRQLAEGAAPLQGRRNGAGRATLAGSGTRRKLRVLPGAADGSRAEARIWANEGLPGCALRR